MHRMIYHLSYGENKKAYKILLEEEAQTMLKDHPDEWFPTHVLAINAHLKILCDERDALANELNTIEKKAKKKKPSKKSSDQ